MAKDAEDKIKELLDPESENFMGTGMTLRELSLTGDAERITRSWWRQGRDEKKRRLSLIVRMSVELEKVRLKTRFATLIAEGAIEDVIEGDRVMLDAVAGQFELDEEPAAPWRDEMRETWAEFAKLVREALTGWPPEDGVEQTRH